MKKRCRKRLIALFIAIIISIIGQTGVILFVRSHYLDKNLNVEFKDVTTNMKTDDTKKVTIPENIASVIPSNNGRYLLYVIGKEAHIVNFEDGSDVTLEKAIIKDGDKNKKTMEKIIVNGDNTNFCWHDIEEKLVISQTNEDDVLGLRMYSYNPKVGNVERALDYENQERTYDVSDYEQRVKNIRLNNAATSIYLKLATQDRSNIYRLDISYGIRKLELMSNNIGNYAILKSLDSIVYEEANKGNLYISDKSVSKLIKINGLNEIKLLGIDNNLLYVAEMEKGLVKSIYSADLSDGYNSDSAIWNKINLDTPTVIENISISRLGNLYYNDNEKRTVINLKTGSKTKYKGEFIGVYKDKLISKEGITIYRKTVK